jgi:NADH-quinone oxidoreductase subunit N
MFIGNLFYFKTTKYEIYFAFLSIAQAGLFFWLITGTQLGTATIVYFVMIYIFQI